MVPEYQLKIADLYNIPIGNVKKLEPNVFNKKKVCASLWELITLLVETRIKTKKNTSRIRIQGITMVKTIYCFNTKKRIEAEKNGDKDEKHCTD